LDDSVGFFLPIWSPQDLDLPITPTTRQVESTSVVPLSFTKTALPLWTEAFQQYFKRI
jgi:hypothetical protein